MVKRMPPGGPFTRWPRATDAVLAAGVFLLVLSVSPGPDDDLRLHGLGDVPLAALAVFLVASAALYWRRSRPLAVFAVTFAATLLSLAFGQVEMVGVAMLFALYSVGRYVANDLWSRLALAAALVWVTISSLLDRVTVVEIAFGLLFISVVWYAGRRVRIRGQRAAQLERERAAEARRAIAEERTRIARELHDVVAHRVSLMTVQAGAAKTVAADDPESASQAMHEVEKAGRQALDELRHLLGVLRPDAESETLGPQSGLADVPRLVDQFRAAGLEVELAMDAARGDLPARVDLSAYRIVQEALTNVLRHAGPGTRAEVRLTAGAGDVAIEVLDNGRGATIAPGSGHGIVGMRERALLLGGSLDAGPRPGGGFQVVARLPIGDERA